MVLWRPTRPSRTNTQKDVLFIIGDWNAKVESQEMMEIIYITLSVKFIHSVMSDSNPIDCSTPGLPVHPEGNQSWIFIGQTDVKAEAPIPLPPDAKNWLIWKDSQAGQDWRHEVKEMTEDEIFGWHHWLDGYEFEKTLRVDDGQGGLVCCSQWGWSRTWLSEWT